MLIAAFYIFSIWPRIVKLKKNVNTINTNRVLLDVWFTDHMVFHLFLCHLFLDTLLIWVIWKMGLCKPKSRASPKRMKIMLFQCNNKWHLVDQFNQKLIILQKKSLKRLWIRFKQKWRKNSSQCLLIKYILIGKKSKIFSMRTKTFNITLPVIKIEKERRWFHKYCSLIHSKR